MSTTPTGIIASTSNAVTCQVDKQPRDVALECLERGWIPIPLCWPAPDGTCGCGRGHQDHNIGKAPLLGKDYQNVRPTWRDVWKWWKRWPYANIGILLEPSGLIYIGPDNPASARWAASQFGGLPVTIIRQSHNPGYLYRRPEGCPIGTLKYVDGPIEVDIKSNGYAVVHGTHRTGCEVYLDEE